MPNKVYIRELETRRVLKEIDVSHVAGTSNYDRFESGLLHNIDLEKYYLDDDDYQAEQENINREKGEG